jgi:hypothetical protein
MWFERLNPKDGRIARIADIRMLPQKMMRNEDIQVLRGIAVSLVVLFHSGTVPVPAGYLGVDVFFVIFRFPNHITHHQRC